ncbi:MAG TPA: hypothetical protein VIR34_06660, partial [Gemmatimonadaceae bacterium]
MIKPNRTQQRRANRGIRGADGTLKRRIRGWFRWPRKARPLVIVAAVALVFTAFASWLATCGFGGCPTAA